MSQTEDAAGRRGRRQGQHLNGDYAATSARPARPKHPAQDERQGGVIEPEAVRALRPQPRRPSLLEGGRFVRLRLLADCSAVAVAAAVALIAPWREAPLPAGHAVVLALPLLTIFLLYLRGQYRRQLGVFLLDELGSVASAVSIAAMALIALALGAGVADRPSLVIAPAWGLGLALVAADRIALTALQRRARRARRSRPAAVIVGAGRVGAQVARRLKNPDYGLEPIGFLDWDPLPNLAADGPPLIGTPEQLPEIVRAHGVSHVIFSFTYDSDRRLLPLVRLCQALSLEVSVVPRLFDAHSRHALLGRVGGLPLISLRGTDPRGWEFALKHAIDRLGAAILILLLSPLLAAIAAGVKLGSPGPVLFRQRRAARDGELFDLLKFRSMTIESEDSGFRPQPGVAPGGVEGEDHRTGFGRLLRRSSLDELPQLFNVLRGEMSLIGPRPERPEFVELFQRELERYGERHRVKSGMTGWAQVHGLCGQTSIADRIEWDNYYIENWSLWLDFKIAVMTVAASFRSDAEA